ncbi:MAG TPA: hypothetical protein VNK82_08885 [Terriglobales bacterium]|nr:hypothetical protein [Terriglobales bacterium]
MPTGAIGIYSYYQRLAQGLRQLMAGARKFSVGYISRSDIAALTPEASRVSGIPMVSDVDAAEVELILEEGEVTKKRAIPAAD